MVTTFLWYCDYWLDSPNGEVYRWHGRVHPGPWSTDLPVQWSRSQQGRTSQGQWQWSSRATNSSPVPLSFFEWTSCVKRIFLFLFSTFFKTNFCRIIFIYRRMHHIWICWQMSVNFVFRRYSTLTPWEASGAERLWRPQCWTKWPEGR